VEVKSADPTPSQPQMDSWVWGPQPCKSVKPNLLFTGFKIS